MAWITIRHPETGGIHTCTEEAFNLAHEDKGWVRVDSAEHLDDLSTQQLVDLAGRLDIELGGSTSKDDIKQTLIEGMGLADTNPANATQGSRPSMTDTLPRVTEEG